MEIAASIRGASKEYKAGDTVITALQPTTFDFMKKELARVRLKNIGFVFQSFNLLAPLKSGNQS